VWADSSAIHAHEPDAHYADSYYFFNSCIFKVLWFSMLPTIPTVLARFPAFSMTSFRTSFRLSH